MTPSPYLNLDKQWNNQWSYNQYIFWSDGSLGCFSSTTPSIGLYSRDASLLWRVSEWVTDAKLWINLWQVLSPFWRLTCWSRQAEGHYILHIYQLNLIEYQRHFVNNEWYALFSNDEGPMLYAMSKCLEMMRDQLREEVTPRRGTANRHKGERNMISWIIGYLVVCDKHGQVTANCTRVRQMRSADFLAIWLCVINMAKELPIGIRPLLRVREIRSASCSQVPQANIL